jgi:uncharacterized membrane protein
MSAALHLAVRLVHVLGMAALVGGSAATWYALRTDLPRSLRLATRFEWLFWASLGLLVVTGVGNLGTLGPPGPATRWGTVLTVKLVVVLAVGLGSAVRSLAARRLRDRGADASARASLRRLYAATAWSLVLIVALAEVLAHG